MKKILAIALALMLTASLLVLPVSAETVKGEGDVAEEPILTVGEGELGSIEIKQYAEGDIGTEQIVQYADEDVGTEEIVQYADEESGFLGWLKNIWQAILNFFGL